MICQVVRCKTKDGTEGGRRIGRREGGDGGWGWKDKKKEGEEWGDWQGPQSPRLGAIAHLLGVVVEDTRRRSWGKVNRAEVSLRKQIPGVASWGGDEKNVSDGKHTGCGLRT